MLRAGGVAEGAERTTGENGLRLLRTGALWPSIRQTEGVCVYVRARAGLHASNSKSDLREIQHGDYLHG